jgi:carbon-monoxide dehydrogenase large subunit
MRIAAPGALVAAELGLDVVDVRRKNFPNPEEFPFKTATGLFYDSGNYEGALDKALANAEYKTLREMQQKARDDGRLIGIGVSTYVEICALGPSQAMPAGGWESATVRIEPTGKVTVLTGVSPHGQGEETAFAQIVADMYNIPLEDVTVIHGDTSIVQYGIGTFGSRGLAVGGTAVHFAAEKLKEKMNQIAAHMLGADASSVVFREGKFRKQRVPGRKFLNRMCRSARRRRARCPSRARMTNRSLFRILPWRRTSPENSRREWSRGFRPHTSSNRRISLSRSARTSPSLRLI